MKSCFECAHLKVFKDKKTMSLGVYCRKGTWFVNRFPEHIVSWASICEFYTEDSGRVMAIDPHYKNASWVLFDKDGTIIGYGENEISEMIDVLMRHRPSTVLIEDQFIGVNKMSALKLSKSAGIIAGMSASVVANVKWVNPRTWKGWHGLLEGRRDKKMNIHEKNKRDDILARYSIKSKHLQDCIMIYEYYKKSRAKIGG